MHVCTLDIPIAVNYHRIWLAYSPPAPISISGKKLLDFMGLQCRQQVASVEIVSCMVRMLTNMENKMYSKIHTARWRHFLPPEWAVCSTKLTYNPIRGVLA